MEVILQGVGALSHSDLIKLEEMDVIVMYRGDKTDLEINVSELKNKKEMLKIFRNKVNKVNKIIFK